MRLSIELGIAMAGGAAVAGVGLWIWRTGERWRQKDPAELERLRRLSVNTCGRIITGKILELLDPVPDGPTGPILLYEYEVAGVTYQAAQDVSPLPDIAAAAPFLPGQTASIKFDPRQPTNSILACEGWCGVPDLTRGTNPPKQPGELSPEASAKS